MIILEPFLRLPEAILRMHFLSDHYGSFWNALMSDWFFSEGWFEYIKTPLGLWYNVFILAWTAVAASLIAIAFYKMHREEKRLTRAINEIAKQGETDNGEQAR